MLYFLTLRIAEIYTRGSTDSMNKAVIEHFKKENSTIRIVLATVAFCIGLGIRDVHQVLHTAAPPKSSTMCRKLGEEGETVSH